MINRICGSVSTVLWFPTAGVSGAFLLLLGPSLEPGNPHPSILEPLGYEQVSSEKQHTDYDNGTKHAMA